jgi:hypothetical protein
MLEKIKGAYTEYQHRPRTYAILSATIEQAEKNVV